MKKPSYKEVIGLKDNYPNFFTRKEQVKQLLDFFLKFGASASGQQDKLLIIHGPQGINKIETIAKAVWYAKEHEEVFETVRDGVYLVDLSQADDMSDVYRAITELPALTGVTAEKKHIL